MLTFWRHGYETTSIADLTDAMGITAPSLYTAFGDKRRLFLEAVRLYAGDPEDTARALEDAPTAYDAARDLMMTAATVYTGDVTPKGCLLASATASGSAESRDVQEAVAQVRQHSAARLETRIARDIADGLLPNDVQAPKLAGLAMALMQGMSVLARDGASREDLVAIVDAGMKAWPRGRGWKDSRSSKPKTKT
ncbi:TetR family transcriptional regulator [Beijerinckiaceae bacterium RH AL1]|nr:TetR family transcriptional regulator [Beijerinckiaceae bacterium RH CH11]VVB47698.1 TetR family transcriptional regulator [Beijerinckiaceae bacterium RH AL8]VVC55979.1 TetR family transcriptional regulator [Beijerinckiaceae bacterium RH AL1]